MKYTHMHVHTLRRNRHPQRKYTQTLTCPRVACAYALRVQLSLAKVFKAADEARHELKLLEERQGVGSATTGQARGRKAVKAKSRPKVNLRIAAVNLVASVRCLCT